MKYVDFTVPYIPVKRRARFLRRTGHTYVDNKTKAELRGVAKAFRESGGDLHDGRVELSIHVFGKLPKSFPKRIIFDWFLVKPDIDNVLKAIMDALNKRAYEDDSAVTFVMIRKMPRTRIDHPSTHVEVRWLDA